MTLENCSVCEGSCEVGGRECWFCEGTGWHPICKICDAPVEPDNRFHVNDLCTYHVLEAVPGWSRQRRSHA